MNQDTMPATAATVPEWDLADRMRKALRTADVGVQEMADYLGVARNTVSTWINGRITPNAQTQRLWALRCGVSYEWLRGTSVQVPAQSTMGSGTGIAAGKTVEVGKPPIGADGKYHAVAI